MSSDGVRIQQQTVGRAAHGAEAVVSRALFHESLGKKLLNALLTFGGMTLFLGTLPIVAAAIKITSRGPIFYRQERVGLNGATYKVLKYRTMRTDAEKDGKPRWASENDPRITPIGNFLRKYRVDEIPQFWNCLMGEMAVIGPRPERPFFVDQFVEEIPHYGARHFVKPGITGLAQIYLSYDDDQASVRKKLHYDLDYVTRADLSMEWLIVFRTITVMLTGFGSR
ncbi:MAG: sugar transferase [Candidatus Poribacteria bacterium]|nr:sugar transferase [Candidatus Poribacteria bacterium]